MAIERALWPCLALWLAGCAGSAPGRFYTHTVRPYTTDFHQTPIGTKHCTIEEHRVQEPVSGYGISAEWSVNQIDTVARAAGIDSVSYTELETYSLLFGLYRKQRLIIHGD